MTRASRRSVGRLALNWRTAFSAALLLSAAGCVTTPPPLECHDYKDLGAVKRICRGTPDAIDAACAIGPLEDNGLSTRFRERTVKIPGGSYTEYAATRALWCPALRTIFMALDEGLGTLLHELCHAAMGLPRAECEARFP